MEKILEAFNLHVPQYRDLDLLYSIIKADPDFLHAFNKKKHFVETPLHFAAGEGRTQLALELQRLMPSFGMKLNADGFIPVHLAMQRGHQETVAAMVRLDPEVVGVQGREGMTLLHYAVAANNVDAVNMLAEFLIWCPDSIKMLTVREETAAHVAVKCRNVAAFKVLVGWMRRTGRARVLGWKDLEGNTAMHLAASTNQPQVMKMLFQVGVSRVNSMNRGGLTALDIVMKLPSDHVDNGRALSMLRRHRAKAGSSIRTQAPLSPLAHYLSTRTICSRFTGILGEYQGIPAEMRSTTLVVAALIATATYQGVLRPPDFLIRPTTSTTNSIHYNNSSTVVGLINADQLKPYNTTKLERQLFAFDFMVPNSVALIASLAMMFLLLPFRPYNALLHFSLIMMMGIVYLMVGITAIHSDVNGLGYIALFAVLIVCVGLVLLKTASFIQRHMMDTDRRTFI